MRGATKIQYKRYYNITHILFHQVPLYDEILSHTICFDFSECIADILWSIWKCLKGVSAKSCKLAACLVDVFFSCRRLLERRSCTRHTNNKIYVTPDGNNQWRLFRMQWMLCCECFRMQWMCCECFRMQWMCCECGGFFSKEKILYGKYTKYFQIISKNLKKKNAKFVEKIP
jgi:hypothetical protein